METPAGFFQRVFNRSKTFSCSDFLAIQYGWAASTFTKRLRVVKKTSKVTGRDTDYQNWHCVTLLRKYTTLDFAIPDQKDLNAFLGVMGRLILTEDSKTTFSNTAF